MYRITNKGMIDNALNNIYRNYDRLKTLEDQISSGKRILKPSDDPVGTVFSMKSNARANEILQYTENLTHARLWLENSESAMDSVGGLLTRVKELAVRGSNGTLTQDDRDKVATELNELLKHMIDLSNSDMAGDHLFAGTKTGVRPFEATVGRPANIGSRQILDQVLAVAYQGDLGQINRNESASAKMKVNENGENAFFDVTRQKIMSETFYADANKPIAPNLRDGYITISGRLGDEVIRIGPDDTLRQVANKITSQSRQVSARVVAVEGGFRLEIEGLRDGKNNQVSIVAGGPPGVTRNRTNLLDLLGIADGVSSEMRQGAPNDRILQLDPNVTKGYFFLNSNLIEVDPSRDTLSSIADRINGLKQDVRADVEDGYLRIRSTGSMVIKDGTSNFPSLMGFPTQRAAATSTIVDNAARQIPLEANEWVRNGNFRLNGQSIGILDVTSESIYDLAKRINDAGTGVTARVADLAVDGYDDRLILESAPGAALTQFVDGTSQFVKSFEFAFKSDAASTFAPDANLQANGVSGKFRIYGTEFEINPVDTLRTVADRINSSALGVRASFDADGRFTLEPVGVTDGFDTNSFADSTGGNFFSSIRFASRVESSVARTSPHIARPLSYDKGAGFVSGTVVVNGKEFAIDADKMNLEAVAELFNKSDLGIAASLNDNNNLVLDARVGLTLFDAVVWRSDDIGASLPSATPLSAYLPPVTAGTITVNGKSVAVDPAGTLDDFINAVNAAGADVVASFDPAANRLRIRNSKEDGEVLLESPAGGSNILSALGLDDAGNRSETNFFRALGMKTRDITDASGNTHLRHASTSAKSLFDIVIEMRDKLLVGDLDGLSVDENDPLGGGVTVPSTLRLIDDAIAHNSEVQTRFGAKMNRVELTETRYREVSVYLERIIAKNEGIEIEKAVVEFNNLQNLYNSSLMVGARVIQPTLMDYLR